MRTLQDYLEKMAQTAGHADALLDTEPSDHAMLLRLRMEQARVMTSYQLFVHRELFEPLLKTGSASEIVDVKMLKVECILLAEEFRAYTRQWSERSPEAEWTEYHKGAKVMVGRICAHIANVRRHATFLHRQRADDAAPRGYGRYDRGDGTRIF